MTGNDYVGLAMRTNDGESWKRLRDVIGEKIDIPEAIHAALGLTGEAGEVSDLLKKHVFHQKELDMIHLKKEVGDVMWYIALMCHACGFNLDEVMQLNIDKLKARYPEGFDVYKANHRAEGDV